MERLVSNDLNCFHIRQVPHLKHPPLCQYLPSVSISVSLLVSKASSTGLEKARFLLSTLTNLDLLGQVDGLAALFALVTLLKRLSVDRHSSVRRAI